MPGVYISYPFCPQKCSFCNFSSGVFGEDLRSRYIELLAAEIDGHVWQWRPDTLYLGGGSPSTLEPDVLGELISRVPGRPWREATIEAYPGTFGSERATAWRRAGINRVSIGVQSFVESEVRVTGRKYDAQSIAGDVDALRHAGIENISIDLIAGLPGQTAESWKRSLDCLEALAIPHASVYILEIDEDSRLGFEVLRKGAKYGARQVPEDDMIAELYETAVLRLAQMGLHRYEISNFARPGSESIHNLKYWTLQPYAGFGADAHSFDGAVRTANVETPSDYVAANGSPACVRTAADSDERFFIGLRLAGGVEPSTQEWRNRREPIERFLSQGLLELNGTHLRLTDRGVLLSNEVLQEFIA